MMAGGKFIEKDVRWRVFRRAVREARAAFADVSSEELQMMIDESIEEVRERNQGTSSVNYDP
jgi:hypothetical protein